MKIMSSKRDEILKRKAQYESDLANYEERRDVQYNNWTAAKDDALEPLISTLTKSLSRFSALDFNIRANFEGARRSNGVTVRVLCNEYKVGADDVALSWRYEVTFDVDTGNVYKETSSWSGLQATTAAQMESLKQTVQALEYLNSIDYADIMNIASPRYSDYVDIDDRRPVREDFEQQLVAAEIEELIGKDVLMKVKNWGETCPYRGDVWLKVERETPAMYIAKIVSDFYVDNISNMSQFLTQTSSTRIKKSNVKPVYPLETIDF